ncbi:Frataxin, mitochondrial-like protein [Drosera capensis]
MASPRSITARSHSLLRTLSALLRPTPSPISPSLPIFTCSDILESSRTPPDPSPSPHSLSSILSRSFCSRPSNAGEDGLVPAPIDYRSVLQEDEFHQLADSTIHDLRQNLEEYGDRIQMDGFDVDYGNQVLTLKLGDLGTYVLNKQTPNRQIWLSSPWSFPIRLGAKRSSLGLPKKQMESIETLGGRVGAALWRTDQPLLNANCYRSIM